jgi:hypothetical protein
MKNKILSILLGALLCATPLSAMQGGKILKKEVPYEIVLNVMLFCDQETLSKLSRCCKSLYELSKKLRMGKFGGEVYPVDIRVKRTGDIKIVLSSEYLMKLIKCTFQTVNIRIFDGIQFTIPLIYSLMRRIEKIVKSKISSPAKTVAILNVPSNDKNPETLELDRRGKGVIIRLLFTNEENKKSDDINGDVNFEILKKSVAGMTLVKSEVRDVKIKYSPTKLPKYKSASVIGPLYSPDIDTFEIANCSLEPGLFFETLPKSLVCLTIKNCVFVKGFKEKLDSFHETNISPYEPVNVTLLCFYNTDLGDQNGDLSFLESLFKGVIEVAVKDCKFEKEEIDEFFEKNSKES